MSISSFACEKRIISVLFTLIFLGLHANKLFYDCLVLTVVFISLNIHGGLCFITADHLAFRCDVSKEEDIQNTFSQMEKSLGYVNYLVNAAGVNRLVSVFSSSQQQFLLKISNVQARQRENSMFVLYRK